MSRKIYENCRLNKLVTDTLYASFLYEDKTQINLQVDEIKSIIVNTGSVIQKFTFSELSHQHKISQLQGILSPNLIDSDGAPKPAQTFYARQKTIILIVIFVLLIITIATIVLIKFKRKPDEAEGIPGVKEMAKTLFFWADYHRGENRDD